MRTGGNLRRWLPAPALVGALALAACGGSGNGWLGAGREPTATTTTTSTTSTTSTSVPPAGIDFVAGSEVDLGDGWTLSPCESGPPLFCARSEGETQAVVELQTYSTTSYASIKKLLDAGGTNGEALRAEASEFHRIFEKDRPLGCGAAYSVERFGPDAVTVGGLPGVLYGFDGKQNGRHVERALNFATIDGSSVHIISTSAIDDGTCMDDGELGEFTIAEMTQLQPVLVLAIAASTLP